MLKVKLPDAHGEEAAKLGQPLLFLTNQENKLSTINRIKIFPEKTESCGTQGSY